MPLKELIPGAMAFLPGFTTAKVLVGHFSCTSLVLSFYVSPACARVPVLYLNLRCCCVQCEVPVYSASLSSLFEFKALALPNSTEWGQLSYAFGIRRPADWSWDSDCSAVLTLLFLLIRIVRLNSDTTLPAPNLFASRGIVLCRDSAQHWGCP